MLRTYGIKIEEQNKDGETGIDVLASRIKNKNPYDENLNSIKLLFCHVIECLPKESSECLKKE